MSGAQTSASMPLNQLYDMATGATGLSLQHSQNQLLQQQQELTDHDIAMTGQAAAPLLGMSEDDAAKAYPGIIQELQARGGAKYAPPSYPGHAATAALVQRAMPILQQIQTGFLTTPGSADATKRLNQIYTGSGTPATAAAPSGGGGTNAPPGTSTPAAPQNLADIHPDLTQFTLPSGVGATVAKSAAPQFQGLLTDLEAAGYKLDPNSTGGYNPRTIAGTNTPSQHAYGLAMDVNWQRNPRGANTPSDIPPDLARKLAAKWGLTWGGDWQGADRDPMHFEVARGTGPGTDHPAGVATGWNANNPLNLTTDTGGVVTPGGARLANYGSMADGVAATAAKLQSFQTDRGLDTVRKMYTEWHKGSPVNEADMQRVAGAMGVGVDQPFQLDPTKTAAWITVAQPGETGTAGKRLSPADIAAGVRQANAASPAPPGGPATPAPYRVASNAPTPPPTSTAPAAQPSYVDRETGLPVIGTQPGAPAAMPQPQAQIPQPPANRAMPGAPDGPPAVAQPPAPAPRANLPRAADVPQGMNSPQIQQAQDLLHRAAQIEMAAAQNPYDKRLAADAAAKAADLKQRAQILMQTDSVVQTQDGQLHVATGVIDKPVPHFVWDPAKGAYVDTTGSSAPVTPPSPRMTNVPGLGTLQSKPGGGAELLAPDIRKPALDALAADRPKIDEITQNGQAAQGAMLRLNEMSDIIPRLATGPSADLRTRGAAWLEQLGASSETIKRFTGMESGSLAEELIKLSIATAGQAAKTDVGSNNGIQSLQLYQSANPGIALLPDANKRMTNMARVYQQMSQDYTQGALAHFNPQQQAILNPNPQDLMTGKMSYSPISNYNQSWQERNNPQIGAAAMGILNGDTFDKWAARATPEQAAAAVAMAARIDPNVRVPTKDGLKPASVILAHPMTPAGR